MKTLPRSFQRHALRKARNAAALSALVAASLLAGCTTIRDTMDGERIDYKSSGAKGPSLDVPPDLTSSAVTPAT